MYGGRTIETRFGGGATSDLFSLDICKQYWQYIKAKPKDGKSRNLPQAREEHSAILMEDNLVVFGGYVGDEGGLQESGKKIKRTNEMYSYSIADNTWEKLKYKSQQVPCARTGHTAVNKVTNRGEFAWLEVMYIFGGRSDGDKKLNDLWQYEYSPRKWTEIKVDWAPPPRAGHSASIFREDFMLIFGGISEVTGERNDLYYFDFVHAQWQTLFENEEEPR